MKLNNKFFKNIKEPIAFVYGDYFITELGVIRSLGRKGIPIVVLDSKRKQISFYSRYCKGITCPNPKIDEKNFLKFLLKIGGKLNTKGVLIPTSGIELPVLLKNRHELEKYFIFTITNWKVVEKFYNKQIFYKTLQVMKIPHPKTYFPNDISELVKISKKVTYPCIVKPAYSESFQFDFHTKLFSARSKRELIHYFSKVTAKNHKVVIQEIIPGNASNKYSFNAYYNRRFKPIGFFMYRKIREWPHMFGTGCFIQSVRIDELKDIITSIVQKIKYYGIVDAEFKVDPRDGLFKLIEINPRLWIQNSLPSRYGINHPYIAYMDAISKVEEKIPLLEDSVKWLLLSEDVVSSLKSILNSNLSIKEWIASYEGTKEYAVFTWDDPLPFLVSIPNLIFNQFPSFIKRLFFRSNVTSSKTFNI